MIAAAAAMHHLLVGRYLQATEDAYVGADIIAIAPRISGHVEQVMVADHQAVTAGQLLVRLEARTAAARVSSSLAQAAVDKAGIEMVGARIDEQRLLTAQARAQLASAQAERDFADSEVARAAPLVEAGAESGQQLQARRRDQATSEQQVAGFKAALAASEQRLATLQAERRQAEARANSSGAQLEVARVDLDAVEIRSASDGRVGNLAVRPGEIVQAGTRLMTVVPADRAYVTANFKETQIASMRIGQPAVVRCDAFPGWEIHGHVESLSPATGSQYSLLPPQNATGNFIKVVQRVPVRIALDPVAGRSGRLAVGLSATVEVDTHPASPPSGADARREASR